MKVLIIDDSPIVRERLINMLSELSEIEVIGEAGDGTTAIDSVRRLKPEAVVLDIRMPGRSGIQVLQDIKNEELAPIVIMLTNYSSLQYRETCLKARADFFLDKSTEFEKVIEVFKELIGSGRLKTGLLKPFAQSQDAVL